LNILVRKRQEQNELAMGVLTKRESADMTSFSDRTVITSSKSKHVSSIILPSSISTENMLRRGEGRKSGDKTPMAHLSEPAVLAAVGLFIY
jgi:hypothetical protein